MGYMLWGNDIQTLDEGFIKETVPTEFNELDTLICNDWLALAKIISSDECNYDDLYSYELLVTHYDENKWNDIHKKILIAFDKLVKKFKEKTKAEISLFTPLAEVERCDIQQNDYFFVVENLYIINKDIPESVINKIYTKNIVQGG